MSNLFEINNDIEKALEDILNSVNEETGEVDEAYVRIFEDLQMQKDEKLENIGCYIKNLNADIKAFQEEEKVMKKRREVLEHKVERLKKYVSTILNGEKWDKSTKVRFGFTESTQTVIDDETLIPKKFLIKKIDYSPDKNAIKEAIKSGKKVKGAHLNTVKNIQVK